MQDLIKIILIAVVANYFPRDFKGAIIWIFVTFFIYLVTIKLCKQKQS